MDNMNLVIGPSLLMCGLWLSFFLYEVKISTYDTPLVKNIKTIALMILSIGCFVYGFMVSFGVVDV